MFTLSEQPRSSVVIFQNVHLTSLPFHCTASFPSTFCEHNEYRNEFDNHTDEPIKSNMIGVISETGNVYSFGAAAFIRRIAHFVQVNTGNPKGFTVPVLLLTTVVILLNDKEIVLDINMHKSMQITNKT
jgi:hypothetical protein